MTYKHTRIMKTQHSNYLLNVFNILNSIKRVISNSTFYCMKVI